MKKLLLIPAILLSITISAQTTIQLKDIGTNQTLTPNAIVQRTTFASSTSKVSFDIKNTSNTAQTYNVKRYDVVLNKSNVDTAAAYFCFAGNCYGKTTTISPTPLRLQALKSASDTSALFYILIADLDEATKVGLSLIKYTFFNVNNANDSVQISVRYNTANVGISSSNKELGSLDIFPNPATDNAILKIISHNAFEGKLGIYNALGAVVSERHISLIEGKNNVQLNLENLPQGIYFVNVRTNESSVTKRLIIK
jgi:hypothetical protein